MLPVASGNGTVLVTGASSGIGEEIAREFARRGRHVVLVARRADELEALAASLGSAADVLAADLSKADERAALPERVTDLGLVVDAVADLCSRFVPGMVAIRR